MSDNLNINGFTCTSNTIFAQLGSKGLSFKELEKLDTNSDKKISEDEFVELLDSEELQQNEKYNNDETIQYYEKQYQEAQTIVNSLNGDIASYRNFQRELKRSMGGLDSESKASVRRQLDEVRNEISSKQAEISSYRQIMANAMEQIEIRMSELNSSTYTNNYSSNNSSGGPYEFIPGSGESLYDVEGDLSVTLDNLSEGLGMTREETADYIASVCQTIGQGYFDPKLILAQIFRESIGDKDAVSDYGAIGVGQMMSCAVEEVNNQFGNEIKAEYGDLFTHDDMFDPQKCIKAMVYLLRYQYERFDYDTGAALSAYYDGYYYGEVNEYAEGILMLV